MQFNLLIAAVTMLAAVPAIAAPQSTTLAFTASKIGFFPGFEGNVALPASVSGSFTFMFDFASPPAIAVPTPLTSISFTAGGQTYTTTDTFFEYPSAGGALDVIGFGADFGFGDSIGGVGFGGGNGDFRLMLGAFGGPFNAQIHSLVFAVPGESYLFESNDISYTVTTATGAVPEPSSWALMIAGFGLVGAAMRRRTVEIKAVAV